MATERQADVEPRIELGRLVAEYKEWRARGGQRGSGPGRSRRQRISELVDKVKDEISWEETVACDVDAHAIDPFEEAA